MTQHEYKRAVIGIPERASRNKIRVLKNLVLLCGLTLSFATSADAKDLVNKTKSPDITPNTCKLQQQTAGSASGSLWLEHPIEVCKEQPPGRQESSSSPRPIW